MTLTQILCANLNQVDPFSRPPTEAQMLEEFTKLQTAERECMNEFRDAERQANNNIQPDLAPTR